MVFNTTIVLDKGILSKLIDLTLMELQWFFSTIIILDKGILSKLIAITLVELQ
jgi:hypothetical protein